MPAIEYFPYLGPNRRCDRPVIEISLAFEAGENLQYALDTRAIGQLLREGGVIAEHEGFPGQALPAEPMARYSSILAQTALLFQSRAGHPVTYVSVRPGEAPDRLVALVEYEHHDVGLTAVKLADELLTGHRKLLSEPFRMFREFARSRALPPDSRALAEAARRRDVPCTYLERQPLRRESFDHLTGGDCLRKNGLLMLGQGCRQQVMDGAFCLDRTGRFKYLLKDAQERRTLLEDIGIPLADAETAGMKQYYLVMVGAETVAVLTGDGGELQVTENVHAGFAECARSLGMKFEGAPLVLALKVSDISNSPTEGGGAMLDFDLAPDLHSYFGRAPGGGELLEKAADAIVDWLFPPPATGRIPVVAVTGTNGKTTTTRMLHRIFGAAGKKPGMVCTDGIFIGDKQVLDGDSGTLVGHLKVLTDRTVHSAVLETHHMGILRRGFAFRRCDIAVCTNVTEDHVGAENIIRSVGQMAVVKRALVERAGKCAVLFADNEHCVSMIGSVPAGKVCLVSLESGVQQLRDLARNPDASCCVLEPLEEGQWIVFYRRGERLPMMSVASIPATFDGKARFNVSNAMHAMSAAYLAGVDMDSIRTAMRGFACGYEATPGRLNTFDELPFRIIMDFAHNPDGLKQVIDFVDRLPSVGRKLLGFSGTGDRDDDTILLMGRTAAGHFEHYFCKEYGREPDYKGKRDRRTGHILKQGLLDAGIPENRITVVASGREAIFSIFDACRPGDLLLMLMGNKDKYHLPGYIREYAAQIETAESPSE